MLHQFVRHGRVRNLLGRERRLLQRPGLLRGAGLRHVLSGARAGWPPARTGGRRVELLRPGRSDLPGRRRLLLSDLHPGKLRVREDGRALLRRPRVRARHERPELLLGRRLHAPAPGERRIWHTDLLPGYGAVLYLGRGLLHRELLQPAVRLRRDRWAVRAGGAGRAGRAGSLLQRRLHRRRGLLVGGTRLTAECGADALF